MNPTKEQIDQWNEEFENFEFKIGFYHIHYKDGKTTKVFDEYHRKTYLAARTKAQEEIDSIIFRSERIDVLLHKLAAKEEAIKKLNEQITKLKEEIDIFKRNLNTCKNDYWFMTNLIERCKSDREQVIKDCIERMKFRKPLFGESND